MRGYLIFLSFLISISISAITKEEAIENFRKNYPEARITDLYKSFYQDNFGPGHILGDSLAAYRYFTEELKDTTSWGGPLYELTGEGNNFIRLNMKLIKEGKVTADKYFKAFINSLGRVEKPSDNFWVSEWQKIDSIRNSKGIEFVNEDADIEYIEEKLKNRDFPIHHSENFNKTYNFHYRIISIPEFEKLNREFTLIPSQEIPTQNDKN